MDAYTLYLAERIVGDSLPVTYRLLSRELKVHTHLAKQILYDFHTKQNQKKPKSVHATYLVSGLKCPEQGGHIDGDGDRSPIASTVGIRTLSLVQEEQLEAIKSSYESVTGVHIYSLQPASLKDLQQLSVVNDSILTKTQASANPLEDLKICGGIINSDARRRQGAKPNESRPSVAPGAVLKPEKKPESTLPQASKGTEPQSSGKSKAPQTKSGALMSSFAKSKPKAQATTPAIKAPSGKQVKEDAPKSKEEDKDIIMQDAFSDDEDYEEDASIFNTQSISPPKPTQRAPDTSEPKERLREERAEKLRAMMDEEVESQDNDVDMLRAEEEDDDEQSNVSENHKAVEMNLTDDAAQDLATGEQPRRKRGRRRVVKKKTYTDEEGYLVTKEEAEWESFSEEETEQKKPKALPVQNVVKKKPPPKGRGNIMSFFGKK